MHFQWYCLITTKKQAKEGILFLYDYSIYQAFKKTESRKKPITTCLPVSLSITNI
jgi:hypothetical protein